MMEGMIAGVSGLLAQRPKTNVPLTPGVKAPSRGSEKITSDDPLFIVEVEGEAAGFLEVGLVASQLAVGLVGRGSCDEFFTERFDVRTKP
jgi:hypothetical protein